MRRSVVIYSLWLMLAAAAGLAANVQAVAAEPPPSIALKASFQPNRLGKSTTLRFGFQISQNASSALSSPLASVSLLLPAGMGLAPTTLGLANCSTASLIAHGLGGCSVNARIGFGTATAAVPLGPEIVHETVEVTALAGPAVTDRLPLLFFAEGKTPVIANLVFPGSLGESLTTTIPPIAGLPGAPYAAVLRFESSIGPAGLIYHIRVHGKTVPFYPTGMVVPVHCPRRGFPFAATFSFQDGAHVTTDTFVPCPQSRHG